jgi:thiamine biosynthesis lipoprotein
MSERENRKNVVKTVINISAVLLLCAAVLAGILLRKPLPAQVEFSGAAMTTAWNVKIVEDNLSDSQKNRIEKLINSKLDFVNIHMSGYHKGGDIYRINVAPSGRAVRVLPQVIDILIKAQHFSEITEGAFDITAGPLIELWGFHFKKSLSKEPSAAVIAEAKSKTGYKNLIIDKTSGTVTKKIDGLTIDLSAIAKGRAVDMVAEALEGENLYNYMVEVGGEVRAAGLNRKGKAWRIGIEQPDDSGQIRIAEVVSLSGRSLATSGDYRSFYMINGRRFSHTIDPHTGRPVTHDLASVSVVADNCMTADALATGLTVLGIEKGMAFARKEGWAVFFINRKAKDRYTYIASDRFLRFNK